MRRSAYDRLRALGEWRGYTVRATIQCDGRALWVAVVQCIPDGSRCAGEGQDADTAPERAAGLALYIESEAVRHLALRTGVNPVGEYGG